MNEKRGLTALEMVKERKVNIENLVRIHDIDINYFMECITQAFVKTKTLNDPTVDARSVVFAVLECAKLGLVPDGKQCAIVPYKGKAVFILGYQGVVDLAYQSGAVRSIWAENVYNANKIDDDGKLIGDKFSYQRGSNPKIDHVPIDTNRNQEDITHTYAVAKLHNGDLVFEVLTREQVEKIRSVSPARSDGPWVKWWDQMAKGKTVKRLDTYLPSTPNMKRAKEIDEVEIQDRFINIPEPIISDKDGVVIEGEYNNVSITNDEKTEHNISSRTDTKHTGRTGSSDEQNSSQQERGSLAEEVSISEKTKSNARSEAMKKSHADKKDRKDKATIKQEIENPVLITSTETKVLDVSLTGPNDVSNAPTQKIMDDIEELLMESTNTLEEIEFVKKKYEINSYQDLSASQANEYYKYLVEKVNG